MKTVLISIAKIRIGNRLRPVNEAWVDVLEASILERAKDREPVHGQEKPIDVGTADGEGLHDLIDGRHRLAALTRAGSKSVWAVVKEMEPRERRLLEIDAQLLHHNLSTFSRAAFLAERKAIYIEIHPETKRGGKGGRRGKAELNDIVSFNFLPFSEETGQKVGLHKDTVTRLTSMYGRLTPASREGIPGSPIEDSRADLDLLSHQSPSRQAKILALVLDPDQPARSVAEAIDRIEGRTRLDAEVKKLNGLLDRWMRMPKGMRRSWVLALPDPQAEEIAALLAERARQHGGGETA
ncbi:ParB N-terminal domain-containing protein [Shumkonia mesophila]|uniref:ParB N-terminal domain-containing protein n=1 Tax=Shumkonia mesophila TaxID=2838854 RepID=UPI00293473A5|nr:ParB N-terminal domain-containing protein [Shumkonia mesophila]